MNESASHTEIERLRAEHYNATVVGLRWCHDELVLLRVWPDQPLEAVKAGQYTQLGLGYWESRAEGCQPEGDITHLFQRVIKRAYSISCPLLDDEGGLLSLAETDFLEFYISLVRRSEAHPPALTPRLFALAEGDRLFCGPRPHGRYTLEGIGPETNVVFAATGTGEAPHNAMTVELLKAGHRGRVVGVTCARWKKDLGYLEKHRRLEAMFPQYSYVALTTREPENLDESLPGYVGKRYLQSYFESGDFERETGLPLDPACMHVFLCGNPDMIGAPLGHAHPPNFPRPKGMVETLVGLGFQIDHPHEPGNIRFEKYW